MIKNQRQYAMSKSRLEEFEAAIAEVQKQPISGQPDEVAFQRLEADAMQSQAESLINEIAEYEALLAGNTRVIEANSIEDLPRALIQARIAAGMSHKELADRLGLKEQQIQRYEATDYESASLSRISEVVNALGLNVRKDILLPTAKPSLTTLWNWLKAIGLTQDFVISKLLPRPLAAKVEEPQLTDAENSNLALRIGSAVGRIFGFQAVAPFCEQPTLGAPLAVQRARFKLPAKASEKAVSVYAVYAHYLALLTLEATPTSALRTLPTSWEEAREAIIARYGAVSLVNALLYAWDLGVVVLPLKDSGAFHGACWRIAGRNVIVLKQRTASQARWLIDLLHELCHALEHPEREDFEVIESDEMSDERRNSPAEHAATEFAGNVVLDGRAEELANLCVHIAGTIPGLKEVVSRIASQEDVSVGALANYLAYRLSAQNQNWWGTAQNLQERGGDPWRIARDLLWKRLDLTRLAPDDRDLLSRALVDMENAHEQ